MIWRMFIHSMVFVLVGIYWSYAQGSSCPCDYFSAPENAEIARYRQQAETVHVRPVPSSIREGRLDLAMADLNYALQRIPNHPEALQLLTVVAQLRKQPGVAISYFERAIQIFPQHALTHAQYGLFLVNIGNLDKGFHELERSIEIDSKLAAGHAALAHAYGKKGDSTKAREAAQKARELGFKGQLPAGR